jgi:hypothetical protein
VKLDDFKAAYLARFNDPGLKDVTENSIDECVPVTNQKAKGKILGRYSFYSLQGYGIMYYRPLEGTQRLHFLL